VSGNSAVNYGGGIYNGDLSTASAPTLTVTGGHITSNSAHRAGGGIDNDIASAGTVTLTNTSVTSNTSGNCVPSGAITGCA
jgi:predicted outer membrane repeat protein